GHITRLRPTAAGYRAGGSAMKGVTLPTETVFVMEMTPIKFGLGATDEIGYDTLRLGVRKALIFTDRALAPGGRQEGADLPRPSRRPGGPAGARAPAPRGAGREGRRLRRHPSRADGPLDGGRRGIRPHEGVR